MTDQELYALKFPVGEFVKPAVLDAGLIKSWIADIRSFPVGLSKLTKDLDQQTLNFRYRPRGWMLKQVVHHCADSHMNALIRFKLSLTEVNPTILPYNEGAFAELIDSHSDDILASVKLLDGLHEKWVSLLSSMSESDLKKTYTHPEHGRQFVLDEAIGVYSWHCRHHLSHIKGAIASKGTYNS